MPAMFAAEADGTDFWMSRLLAREGADPDGDQWLIARGPAATDDDGKSAEVPLVPFHLRATLDAGVAAARVLTRCARDTGAPAVARCTYARPWCALSEGPGVHIRSIRMRIAPGVQVPHGHAPLL